MTVASKTHFSAAELADMQLPCLPTSRQGVDHLARREQWGVRELPSRGRAGIARTYAITSLPQEAQAEIRRRQAQELQESATTCVILPSEVRLARREEQLSLTLTTVERLTSKQRAVAEARCALVGEVKKFSRVMGIKAARQPACSARTTPASGRLCQRTW
ncbi:Transposase [Laribacter hongkongensis HLHK9]|uniref:Transposase n=1 Tax=Laribacter hongkongensis (strain HLHK9) TaxID=557598 RepID=C1D6R1_LARHH|nr:DNA-binding protein [Laribacter hongkongensis]ACO74168.1 Transposase [Laribacter hongkongensis HLHK9]